MGSSSNKDNDAQLFPETKIKNFTNIKSVSSNVSSREELLSKIQIKKPETKIENFTVKELKTNKPHLRFLSNIGEKTYNAMTLPTIDFVKKDFENMFQLKETEKKNCGLEELFRTVFPILHKRLKIRVEYVRHECITDDTTTVDEHVANSSTRAFTVRVLLRISSISIDKEHVFEYWNTMGEIPQICSDGTFIVNGKRRIFISQIHRAPGFIILKNRDNKINTKISPHVGSWLHTYIEKNQFNMAINKRKKFSIASFLWSLFVAEKILVMKDDRSEEEIEMMLDKYKDPCCVLKDFYEIKQAVKVGNSWEMKYNFRKLKTCPLVHDMYHKGEIIVEKGGLLLRDIKKSIGPIKMLCGLYVAKPIYDDKDNIVLHVGQPIQEEHLEHIKSSTISYFEVNDDSREFILNSFALSGVRNCKEAFSQWAKHGGVNINPQFSKVIDKFIQQFCKGGIFDFQEIGVHNIKRKLNMTNPDRHLSYDVFSKIIKNSIKVFNGEIAPDKIDSLANKHIRCAGSIMLKYIQRGVSKMSSIIPSKLPAIKSMIDSGASSESQLRKKVSDCLNLRPSLFPLNSGVIADSHLIDNQTQFSKYVQSFKVTKSQQAGLLLRPDSASQYSYDELGRFCPTKTTEGQKTGLTVFLAAGVKIDDFGFLYAAYYPVKNGVVSSEAVYLTASEDDNKVLAFTTSYKSDKNGNLVHLEDQIYAIQNGQPGYYHYSAIDYVFVHLSGLFSISVIVVFGIHFSYAYRSLVASNLICQSIPIVQKEAPYVSSGFEYKYDSCVRAKEGGVVVSVDASRILIHNNQGSINKYKLKNFKRTNANTCLHQSPIVKWNQKIEKGEIIACNNDAHKGMSIGANLNIAFIGEGYTYEDGMCGHKELPLDHISIHKVECEVLDTRGGLEKTTANVPGIPPVAISYLDENGIVEEGTFVKSNDIVVGKVAVRHGIKSDQTRFVNTLLNQSNNDLRDISVRTPYGVYGTVLDVSILSGRRYAKDDRSLIDDAKRYDVIAKEFEDTRRILWKKFCNDLKKQANKLKITIEMQDEIGKLRLQRAIKNNEILRRMCDSFADYTKNQAQLLEYEKDKIRSGYDLKGGVVKKIIVTIGRRNKLKVGDKLSGRSGNKGTISKIIDKCHMPFCESTGEIVDIIISSSGIVSRANFNQIIEMHLAKIIDHSINRIENLLEHLAVSESKEKKEFIYSELKKYVDILSGKNFIGARSDLVSAATHFRDNKCAWILEQFAKLPAEDISNLMISCGLNADGKRVLVDGLTGKKLEGRVIFGVQYIGKLVHLIVNKFHARSSGNYADASGQPLSGKVNNGGQRVGGMEIFTLGGYGASCTLKELIDYKSSNSKGRFIFRRKMNLGDTLSTFFEKLNPGAGKSFSLFKHIILALNIDLSVGTAQDLREEGFTFGRGVDKDKEYATFKLLNDKEIMERTCGEVTEVKTIHYSKGNNEEGGLFDSKIFGINKLNECECGRIKGQQYRGSTCQYCGVTAMNDKDRLNRIGHMTLPRRMCHPWFFGGSSGFVHILLDMTAKRVMSLVKLESYYVFEPGSSSFSVGDIIDTITYDSVISVCGDVVALTGGDAIFRLLKELDLIEVINRNKELYKNSKSSIARKKYTKVINVAYNIIKSGFDLTRVTFKRLVVVPIVVRKIYEREGNQYATSDINQFYLFILQKIKRFKDFSSMFKSPSQNSENDSSSVNIPRDLARYIIQAIQEAINDFYVTTSNTDKNTLESIQSQVSSKTGLIRQYLLGFRVDQSGRSAIVSAGANIPCDTVLLPYDMILILFKKSIVRWLQDSGIVTSYSDAVWHINNKSTQVWHVVNKHLSEMIVIITRQPSLHRHSTRSFKIKIASPGVKAIGLHPLVCEGYNADFDGDTVSVIVLSSIEAKAEAAVLQLASNNVVSYSSFNNPSKRLVMKPNKDMLLGLYFLTLNSELEEEPLHVINYAHLDILHDSQRIKTDRSIRWFNELENRWHNTTAGRLIFWDCIPEKHLFNFEDFNCVIRNSHITEIVLTILRNNGNKTKPAAKLLDDIKYLGFKFCKLCAGSFSCTDMPYLESISKEVEKNKSIEKSLNEQIDQGLVTEKDVKKRSVDIWSESYLSMLDMLERYIDKNKRNPLFATVVSKARGSLNQLLQVMGAIGVVGGLDGDLIFLHDSYIKGLSPISLMILSNGARGECQSAMSETANTGYSARKLAILSNGVIVRQSDCGSLTSNYVENSYLDGELIISVYDGIFGRTLSEDMQVGEQLLSRNTLIDDRVIKLLKEHGIAKVPIRSIDTCITEKNGVCRACYGGSPDCIREFINIGDTVGIAAAQAIAEPLTQFALRSYHGGGKKNMSLSISTINSDFKGIIRINNLKTLPIDDKKIVISHNATIEVYNKRGDRLAYYDICYGSHILVENNQECEVGTSLSTWYKNFSILAHHSGTCQIINTKMNINVQHTNVQHTKNIGNNSKNKLLTLDHNSVVVIAINDGTVDHYYNIPAGHIINVRNGDTVELGAEIAKKSSSEKQKTIDLESSLEVVLSALENRSIKNPSILSGFNGVVRIGSASKIDHVSLQIELEDKTIKSIGNLPRHRLLVEQGDVVVMGQKLTRGNVDFQSLIDYTSIDRCRKYFISLILGEFYKNGVSVAALHLEVIFKSLVNYYKIKVIQDNTEIKTKQDLLVVNDQKVGRNDKIKIENYINTRKKDIKIEFNQQYTGVSKANLNSNSILTNMAFQCVKSCMVSGISSGSNNWSNMQPIDPLNNLHAAVMCGADIKIGTTFLKGQLDDIIEKHRNFNMLLSKSISST